MNTVFIQNRSAGKRVRACFCLRGDRRVRACFGLRGDVFMRLWMVATCQCLFAQLENEPVLEFGEDPAPFIGEMRGMAMKSSSTHEGALTSWDKC